MSRPLFGLDPLRGLEQDVQVAKNAFRVCIPRASAEGAIHKNTGDQPIMSILGRVVGLSRPRLGKRILFCLLSSALLFAAWPQNPPAYQDPPAPAPAASAPRHTQQTTELLQHLVVPIATSPACLDA